MEATIKISKAEGKLINNLLSLTGEEIYKKYGYKRDETITHTAKFPNGIEADIKLVICEEDTPYTEGVLFLKGQEIQCTEPQSTYDGEWCFEHDGTQYVVNVTVDTREDIIGFLEPIMKRNTKHYQSDFEIDKEMFWECSKSSLKEDKVLLWFSRDSGTHCLRLANVFLDGSWENQTVKYFANHEGLKAYLVWLDSEEDGKILGKLKRVSWKNYASKIIKSAVPTSWNLLFYEKGEIMQEEGKYMQPEDPKLGKLLRCRRLPDNPEDYKELMLQVM